MGSLSTTLRPSVLHMDTVKGIKNKFLLGDFLYGFWGKGILTLWPSYTDSQPITQLKAFVKKRVCVLQIYGDLQLRLQAASRVKALDNH